MTSNAKIQNGKLSGVINTMEHYFGFELEPVRNTMRDRAPTHEIMAKKSNGAYIKIGIAWERPLKRGEHQGKMMYSLVFDDPMFSKVMTFSAFPEDAENYSVNYERPRQNAPVNNATISDLAPPASQETGQAAVA